MDEPGTEDFSTFHTSGTEIKAPLATRGGIMSIQVEPILIRPARLAAPHYELSLSFKMLKISLLEAKLSMFEN
jgi:hypothetical protein